MSDGDFIFMGFASLFNMYPYFYLFLGAGDGIQGLARAKHTLYQ